MECILAIDQGTHASRAILFNRDGEVIGRHEERVDQYETVPGQIELAPEQVLASVRKVIAAVLEDCQGTVHHAGMAVQRSTLVAWERGSGEALAPALSWQDTRSRELLRHYRFHEKLIHQISGLPLSPHYLAGKMRWLLEQNESVQEALRRRDLVLAPLGSYLARHLLREHPLIVDHSNAARSMLFNLEHGQWSRALCELFQIPAHVLPACVPTLAEHGRLEDTDIPLTCLCGDQNAALHAYGDPPDSQILLNLGSGAFLLHASGNQPLHHPDLISGVAWSDADTRRYLLEASVNGVGNAIRWLQERSKPDILRQLPDWLHEISGPPLFLNTVGGLGSPFWRQDIEPRFIPDTESVGRRAVAVLESIVFLLQCNLEVMDLGGVEAIQVSGGLSQINGLCQRIADLSGLPLQRHDDPEATARGVAWLAAGRPAHWPGKPEGRRFQPARNDALRHRYEEFRAHLDKALENGTRVGGFLV